MKMEEFTIEQGLTIQAQQLLEWKSVLTPEKYEKLQLHNGQTS